MTELDTYAIPEGHGPAYATGFGDLTIHEVATSSRPDRPSRTVQRQWLWPSPPGWIAPVY